MRSPELLCPAGSLPVLKCVVRYGADAVYLGGETFSLRAHAKNFTEEEMREGISFAHANGVKVYVTANIFAHETDLAEAAAYFTKMNDFQPDALLISDPGLFELAKEYCPGIPVHLSTQANTTNSGTCRFWYRQGVRRVVLARELPLAEIRTIKEAIPEDMELEAFVHGAMCISYSGRCLLSSYFTGRDANRGDCTHPCRWNYHIMEETRPGQFLPVYENERGTYLFNSKDLCMIRHLPELIDAGITSLKIEGRMKTALYAATVTRAYRLALDTLAKDPAEYEAKKDTFFEMVQAGTVRPFTTGFYFGRPDDGQIYDEVTYQKTHVFLGIAENIRDGRFVLHQKNKFSVGSRIEILKPDGRDISCTVTEILTAKGPQADAPHPGQELFVGTDAEEGLIEPGDVIRMRET